MANRLSLGSAHVIGIGIDLVDVARFRATLARTPTMRERCFTTAELAYADRRPDPTEALAARFAAKEATMKALSVGLGAFGFHDVEVVVEPGDNPSGPPQLRLTGAAAGVADALGVNRLLVSLTHTSTLAQAMVLAQRT